MIEKISESNFDAKVLDANGKVVVEFFATWCPHCQRMMPVVEKLAEVEAGNAKVYQVDVDKSPTLTNEYAPDGFPTFLLFENGQVVSKIEGETTLDALESMVG